MPPTHLTWPVLRFALCWLGALAIGFGFYGQGIFQPDLALFQFVATGAIAAFAVAVATTKSPRWMLLVFIAGFLLTTMLARSTTPARFLRDAVLVIAVILAVQVSLRWDRLFPRIPLGKFILWAGVFGILHAAATALLAVVLGAPLDRGGVLLASRIGVLIGAGVGVGHELSSLLVGNSARGRPGPAS